MMPSEFRLIAALRLRDLQDTFQGYTLPEVTTHLKAETLYPHFQTKRGFAVTFFDGMDCDIWYANKILTRPLLQVDAIIRHELGHVVDFALRGGQLESWARARRVPLPSTPELKADALAEAIWGDLIYYDADAVQTLGRGQRPRPAHLSP